MKIIFVSGYADFHYAKTAIQMNASSYILKPVVDSELFECLRQVQQRLNDDRKLKQMDTRFYSISEHTFWEKRKPQHRIVHEIEQYVSRHLSDNINLREVAHHFAFSPNYLGHLFKEAKQVNFSDYVISIRIEKAKQLLKHPTLKIYEVAEQVGYKKLAYFSHHFKAHVGLTPGEFRKQ